MTASVGVIIPITRAGSRVDAASCAARALRSIAPMSSGRVVLVTDAAAEVRSALGVHAGDARVRVIDPGNGHWLTHAVEHADAEWCTLMHPMDEFEPANGGGRDGLSVLMHAATPTVDGVVGGAALHTRIGPVPRSRITPRDAVARAVLPPHACLAKPHVWRRVAEESSHAAWATPTALFAIAAGVRAALASAASTVIDDVVARVHLRDLDAGVCLDDLVADHCSAARSVGVRTDEDDSAWVQAHAVSRLHTRVMREVGPHVLSDLPRFPVLFAQWWARAGFFGAPPRHLLESEGGVERLVQDVPAAAAVELLDSALAAGVAEPVLVGLGRNARVLAQIMHRRGVRVRGVDHAMDLPPAWASEDGVPLELLPPGVVRERPGATIVTPWNDRALLEREPTLAAGLRWSNAANLALASSAACLGLPRHAAARDRSARATNSTERRVQAACAR